MLKAQRERSQEMIDALAVHPSVRLGVGVTEEVVREAERILSSRLPLSYREFLLRYGTAEIHSNDIYGLGESLPRHLNVIDATGTESFNGLFQLCNGHVGHVCIAQNGRGDIFCLDTDRREGKECPVVFWDHEHPDPPKQKPRLIARSFANWILKYLRTGYSGG